MCSIPSTPKSPLRTSLDGKSRDTADEVRFGAMLLAADAARGRRGLSSRTAQEPAGEPAAIAGLVALHDTPPGTALRGREARPVYRDGGRLALPTLPERLAGPVRRLTAPRPHYAAARLGADAIRRSPSGGR